MILRKKKTQKDIKQSHQEAKQKRDSRRLGNGRREYTRDMDIIISVVYHRCKETVNVKDIKEPDLFINYWWVLLSYPFRICVQDFEIKFLHPTS